MKMIKVFEELNRHDANIAGGKGASLGEMTNVGIPVPPGFVVLSDAFEYFIRETDIISEIEATLKKVNHKEMESVERASEIIRDIIEEASMPKNLEKEIMDAYKTLDARWVAVRSSATAEDGAEHAWAGQLDSFLNTKKENVIKNVQRCFASLFTPRAIFYRFEKGLHNTHISVAVVIQKMVQSEKSGIAFSVHPVTEDHNQMIIEGSWGLGEAIVSGQVTPDSYVVTKKPKAILDTNIAEKSRGLFKSKTGTNEWEEIENKKANEQCLSGKEILELSNVIIKIESHYGFPCDIEWAYENKKFYIVQSRPITTLQSTNKKVTYFPNGVIQMGQWSLSPLATECWNNETTQKKFKDKFGLERDTIIIHKINPLYQLPFYSKDFFQKLDLRIADLYKKTPKKIGKELSKFYIEVEKAKKEVSEMKSKNLELLSNKKLIEVFKKNRKLVGEITVYDQFGWLSENALTAGIYTILKSKGLEEGSEKFNEFLFKLTKPKHISTTLKEKLAVYKSALVCKSKPAMLEKNSNLLATQFGFMPIFSYGDPWQGKHYEKELVQAIKLPLDEIRKVINELKDYTKKQQQDFFEAKKNLKLNPSETQRFVDFGLALDTRNEAEYFVSFAGEHLINIVPEIARRLKSNVGKVSLLFVDEISECLEGKTNIKDVLKERTDFTAVGFLGEMKRKKFGNDEAVRILEDFDARKSWIQGDEDSSGKCGSPGTAKGRVKICKTPQEINKVKQGDVLITYATTVDYLPAMKLASAIVTEVGGITCHAAVVSREFGIPCVIGLKNAMLNFKDNDLVEVNADRGVVKIIKL
ncbi:MAG: PEP/pyruvate-binding domain-containing protein [Patescibacteria group bacterium]